MSRDLWNSPAAVIRMEGNSVGQTVAIGRLHEMIEHLLRQPVLECGTLVVRIEGYGDLITAAEAQDLRSRADFPMDW